MATKLTLAQKLRRKADLIERYKAEAATVTGTDAVSRGGRKYYVKMAEFEQTRMDVLMAQLRPRPLEQPGGG